MADRRTSMLVRLAAGTADLHAELDDALFEPLAYGTLAEYRTFLCQLYGFHAPLEAALMAAGCIDADFLRARLKAPALAADLLALGLAPADYPRLARRHEIPVFRETAEAYAWLYVTERLTLQLPGIEVQLAEDIPEAIEVGGAYVGCYDGDTARRWRELGVMLDDVAWAPELADRLVDNARAGLRSLLAWVRPPPAVRVPEAAARGDDRDPRERSAAP